jgi:hypothetical protein
MWTVRFRQSRRTRAVRADEPHLVNPPVGQWWQVPASTTTLPWLCEVTTLVVLCAAPSAFLVDGPAR